MHPKSSVCLLFSVFDLEPINDSFIFDGIFLCMGAVKLHSARRAKYTPPGQKNNENLEMQKKIKLELPNKLLRVRSTIFQLFEIY